MADAGAPPRTDSGGSQSAPSSTNSVKSLASPRKQGRFLIIEPPRMEEEDDLSDSSSSARASPRFGVTSDIESRFGMATRQPVTSDRHAPGSIMPTPASGSGKAPLSSASSDTVGSATQASPPPSSSNGTVAPFVVKNTDGPLFDPAMAAAFGWDEAESLSASDEKSVLASCNPPNESKEDTIEALLPPMSAHGSGQLSRKERERMRQEWFQNILAHKQEQEKAALEREHALTEIAEKKRALRLKQQNANKGAETEAAPNSSLHPNWSPERNTTKSNVQVLDLATYQASKRLSEETQQQLGSNSPTSSTAQLSPNSISSPGRKGGHRRSLSDLSIEAKMQARRDSGPPPPRPSDASSSSTADSEDLTLTLKKIADKEATSPRKNRKPKLSPPSKGVISEVPVTVHDPLSSSLASSFSDTDISSSADSIRGSPTKKKKPAVVQDPVVEKGRGRSASVSKKIGVFIGRIFETKPKQEKDRIGSSKTRSKPSLSVSSSSVARIDASTIQTHPTLAQSMSNSSGGDDTSQELSASLGGAPPVSTAPIATPITAGHSDITKIAIGNGFATTSSSAPQGTARDRTEETSSSSPPHLQHSIGSAASPAMVSSTSSESVHWVGTTLPDASSSGTADVAHSLPSSRPLNSSANTEPPSSLKSGSDAGSDTSARSSRPRPPVPPKPQSFRHANTMRPSTSTKKEFGLDDD